MNFSDQVSFFDRVIMQNREAMNAHLDAMLNAINSEDQATRSSGILSSTQFIEACAQNIRQAESDRYRALVGAHVANCLCPVMDTDEIANGMRCEYCANNFCLMNH